ncbi:proteasome subunit alpha [Candidatus Poribacteria bacterium]|nr:proteasome subunit alpha [Candidatus Poribacteria bacterium]
MEYKGDFLSLVKANGYKFGINAPNSTNNSTQYIQPTEGTTVIAVRYSEGVVIAGDRRAIAGTSVIYDRADKVIDIDDYSVLAISGSPAIAYELARVLENSFKYYRRSQLQELSLEGKLRLLSKLLRDNLPLALQGLGAVIPIFAAYDEAENGGAKIFFYDVLGAQFECADFATTGSGSVWIRGALYYLNRWGEKRLVELTMEESITTVLRLLDAASEYDAATGGYNRKSNIFPLVKTITQEGIREMSADYLSEIYTKFVEKTAFRD